VQIKSCLYKEWVIILIGSTRRDHYTFTVVSYRGSHYIVSYTIVNFFLFWFDVLISGILQIGPAALLVPAPQPLFKRRSGVVSVFWTVRLVQYTRSVSTIILSGRTYSCQNVRQIWESTLLSPTIWSDIVVVVGRESGYLKIFFYISRGEHVKHFVIDAYL
jgi:hypothetical protein